MLFLFYAYLLPLFECAAGLEAVELLDRTGADGVGLAYGIGRFALAADVGVGIALPALLLALDVDHLVGHRLCLLVLQVVELTQVACRNAELLPDILERVALFGQHVVYAVGLVDIVAVVGVDRHPVVVRVDGRRRSGNRFDAALVGEPPFGIGYLASHARGVEPLAVGPVEQVELVLLDDAREPLRVVGRRGVAGGFEPPCPALVIVGRVGEQRVVAWLRIEEFGMVPVRRLDRGVAAEALPLGVVVVIDLVARPVAFALDAEMVVRLQRQPAVAAVGLEDALRHGDAGGDAVPLHVGHGDGFVTVDIFLAGLPHLCREALQGYQ